MSFYSILDERGLSEVLNVVDFVPPRFVTESKVLTLLKNIVANNESCFIIGDYDVDGLKSVLTLRSSLESLGCTNINCFQYKARTHALDMHAVHQAIQGRYSHVIIADTGSSNLEEMKLLLRYGIKVIVLDHHETSHSYSDFGDIAIINTTIENKILGENRYALSAGALCFCVMARLYEVLGQVIPTSISCYAVVSLYADCMDMSNPLNRSIYYLSQSVGRNNIPVKIKTFLTSYMSFSRRFIEFTYSPKINALFRSERFEYINKFFLETRVNADELALCYKMINENHAVIKQLIDKVTDIILAVGVEQLDNFVLCDLGVVSGYVKIEENKLYNYTGLIANKLCDVYGKSTIVYCNIGTEYKGSLRDMYGRHYLKLFQHFCTAGGHNPAFGFTVGLFQFNDFIADLKRIDKIFTADSVDNAPIIVDYEYNDPDNILVEDMAKYNEFSGMSMPICYISKRLYTKPNVKKGTYNYVYPWGNYSFQSKSPIVSGTKVKGKPTINGSIKIYVQ